MSKKIRLVIFDLDGTLVDAYPAIVSSFNFTMGRLRLPLQDDRTIRRAVGWGDSHLLEPFVPASKLRTALSIYRRNHQKALREKTRFLPGAKRILNWLKNREFKLAVASNRPTKFSYIILEHLKIIEYFDYILCADKIRRAKPYPDILFCILKKLSVKPAQALYVGDMTVDIITGKRAKIKTVAITTGSSTKKEISALKPFRVVRHISQLGTILRAINNGYFTGRSS